MKIELVDQERLPIENTKSIVALWEKIQLNGFSTISPMRWLGGPG